MRYSRIALAFVGVFAALWVASISTAQACDPVDYDYGAPADAIWCQARYRTPVAPTPAPTATPIIVAAVLSPSVAAAAAAPKVPLPPLDVGGDSPSSALDIDQNEHAIAGGQRIWYKIGINGNHFIVWMHTNGAAGLGFGVYAPDQKDIELPTTKPKGLGTYPETNPNDLNWAGGHFLQIGTWYALVTNNSANTLSYRLDVTQQAVEKVCTGPYWEILPGGAGVYWNLCK